VRHHGIASAPRRIRRSGVVLMVPVCMAIFVPSPAAPAFSQPVFMFLRAVTCPSTSNCIAAGTYTLGDDGNVVPGVAQWNGTKWTTTAVPVPPDPPPPRPHSDSHGTLYGVACATATTCFAVGNYTIERRTRALIDRWDGKHWVLMARPRPAGAASSGLNAVSCASAASCVAVGAATISGSAVQTFAVRWNGAQWSTMPAPTTNGAVVRSLLSVSCTTAANCFAVGTYVKQRPGGPLVEHWDGRSWSIVPSASAPSGTLLGVSCVGSTSCYAAGNTGAGDQTLIEHWNGTKWSIVNVANPASASAIVLRAISCSAANRCFAVGRYNTPKGRSVLYERWSGAHWKVVQVTGRAAGVAMYGVDCRSATFCVAVGGYLVNRWNGATWTADRTAP